MTPANKDRRPGRPPQTLRAAFAHALDGLCDALRSERNMKIHSAAAFLMFGFALVVRPPLATVALVAATWAVVMGAEQLNTAVELLTDHVCAGELSAWARRVKDVAAGAVLTVSAGAAAVVIYVLSAAWPWRWRLFTTVHPLGACVSVIGLILMAYVFGRAYWWERRRDEWPFPRDLNRDSQP